MSEVVVKSSRHLYADTLKRLTKAIADGGSTVFDTIDQSAAAQNVGLALRPTALLIFGNPKGGTPLMDACPLTALDLPLKVLVWEENGEVNIAYTPVRALAARYAVTGKNTLIAALDHALETLVGSVT